MSASTVQSLISSAQIYSPDLYQAAEKGSTCKDPKISVESTNVIMQILSENVIGPLSEIPDLVQQVEKGKIDTDTSEKVERVFHSVGFTPSKIQGPRLDEERKDLALRTANLFRSEFKRQLGILALYVFRSRKFPKEEALQSVLGSLSGGSLSSAVGSKALDVFKADLVIQKARSAEAKQRSAEAKQRSAEAKQRSAEAKQRSAEAKAFIEERDEFMVRVLHKLGEEIKQGRIR